VSVAHSAVIPVKSLLGSILDPEEVAMADNFLRLPINSSHHQAIGIPGDGLHISARCPQDGVIEAIEGPQHADGLHFVLGLQWHPERTISSSATSRAIFSRFAREAAAWTPRAVTTSVLN